MQPSARDLSPINLLSIWERGRLALPVERALLLLEAVLPSEPNGSTSSWTIGQRDAALFELRRDLFGDVLECVTRCQACMESLELVLHTDELLALRGDLRVSSVSGGERVPQLDVDIGGRSIRVRLPTQEDVLAVARAGDDGVALLERCMLDAPSGAGVDTMSPEIIDSISTAIAEADPLADLELAVVCPACGNRWTASFDIASFLWSELESWALRTLREVHALASAYGWREADILSLSPARRAAYLELVRA
jgi:hypothetical protein